jgi:hypothetical protein
MRLAAQRADEMRADDKKADRCVRSRALSAVAPRWMKDAAIQLFG